MRSPLKAWLFAACAIAGFGCSDTAETQVLTGRVTTDNAVAVRAIDGDTIITAGRVRSDGSFTLQLPAGHRYRLEVLTTDGVHNVVAKTGALADITFKVCEPTDPFDMGGFGEPGCDPMDPKNTGCGDPCDPMTDPNCGGGNGCDPSEPWCPDGQCDPMNAGDPDCKCDPMTDPNCGGGGGGGGCDPNDPWCWDGVCDPMNPKDPDCKCDPTTDPDCGMCQPGDPNCGGNCDPSEPGCPDGTCDPMNAGDPDCKCDPTTDPNCGTTCDPTQDAMCPTPPPPCPDPMDPNTCKDPCVDDPMACGCAISENDGTMKDPNDGNTCWPEPEQCTMKSCPDDPMAPDNMPPDFGCKAGEG
jgi:hypothetical protein